jgi:hypothetical protein
MSTAQALIGPHIPGGDNLSIIADRHGFGKGRTPVGDVKLLV